MPTSKSARARMKDAVNEALARGDCMLANEITANVMVGTTMMIVFAVMLLCLLLNEVGVFTADKSVMRYAVLAAGIVEAPITVINTIYVGVKKWLKIPLMVDLILVCAILAATLGHNVTLVMVFPVIVSTRYFDEKYTKWVAYFSAIVFAGACVFCAYNGIVNMNMVKLPEGAIIEVKPGETIRDALLSHIDFDRFDYVKSLLINEFAPRCLIFLSLSVSCRYVAGRGKDMIEMQSETTGKASRIETELNLATKIQTSMLPCLFPAFPDHEDIELQAVYYPAKEVGGDFYDYFVIDNTHVGVVIADVSGKGVGAALFMTISKTVIKNQLQLGISPEKAMMNANAQLCENNDAGLFVTCWAGVYDTESRKLTFVNAGHNPPVLLHSGKKPHFIPQRNGFVLAGMDGFKYKEEELQLEAGDEMFFYTDGVTEATNAQNELYGNDRLLDCLEEHTGKDAGELIKIIKKDIDDFVDGAEQFDDITIMAMKTN